MLDFFLLVLHVKFPLRQIILLALDDLPVLDHFLVQFLLETAHQGIHHQIAVLLDFELAVELVHLGLDFRLTLLLLLQLLLRAQDFALQVMHGLLRINHQLFRLRRFELFLVDFGLKQFDSLILLLDYL